MTTRSCGADVLIGAFDVRERAGGITANDALMELLLMIDAAVGAAAHRVIAVKPWFGYSRQDRSRRRGADLGATGRAHDRGGGRGQVLKIDLHAGQIQGSSEPWTT